MAPPELRAAMQRLSRQVELGRSSADDFTDLVAGSAVPAAVSRLAGMTA
jgi:hypothetical protein